MNQQSGRCFLRLLRRAFNVSVVPYVGLLLMMSANVGLAAPRMRIVGYINVASGCQADTVGYLKRYASQHRGQVSLELVDFGTEDGFARWRGDGFTCETILVNGSSQFRVGSGTQARIVVFRMPEGVRWTFADLSAVLAQELKSPKASILSDSQAQQLAKRTPVASRRSRQKGKEVGEVIVAAQTVFRFSDPLNGKSAGARAREAASTLTKLYKTGLTADEVRVAQGNIGGAMVGLIVAREKPVAIVGEKEAAHIKRKPVQAAQFWAFNLRDALRLLGR